MLREAPLDVLVSALKNPEQLHQLALDRWDLLLRQARSADMLARLACRLQDCRMFEQVPTPVQRHLEAANRLASRQQTELAHEVMDVRKALDGVGVPTILLKGAAYSLAKLAAGDGRMVSDLDILVPQDQLPSAESGLMKAGWVSTSHDAYDHYYYRTWMHEIPPLEHVHRGSVLDVHHSVIPPTAGYALNSEKLLNATVEIVGLAGVRVLMDVDMVLHSAVHLMHEGELEMGFRGLVDIDALVTEFAYKDAGFWDRLIERAIDLDLQRPAFLALRYAKKLLGTPVPDSCSEGLRVHAKKLGPWRLMILDALYERGLRPQHASFEDRFSSVARSLLFARAHLLRMPAHLLLPHLARKSWRRMLSIINPKESINVQA